MSIPEFKEEWFEKGHKDVIRPSDLAQSGFITYPLLIKVNPSIKCVVCIPKFTLATSLARSVLPSSYSRHEVVFNLGRITILTHALSQTEIDPLVIHECMQDKIHQEQRKHLVPGLAECLALKPSDVDGYLMFFSIDFLLGLLGVCLSGAGPTVLALATGSFDEIGTRMVSYFTSKRGKDGLPIEADYMVLDFDSNGVICQEV